MRSTRLGLLVSTAVALCWCGTSWAQESQTGFLDRRVVVRGVPYDYQVYVPRGYRADEGAWPVILSLSGSGNEGDDGVRQTRTELAAGIRSFPGRWPAIAIFPQVRHGETWITHADVAMAALDETLRAYRIDSSRVYLVGYSMGGSGAWYLGYRHPERFAALVVTAGYVGPFRGLPSFVPSGDPYEEVARRTARLPTWIVHGSADAVVPVTEARRMSDALKRHAADVRYSEVPGDHDVWGVTYGDEAIAAWLFAQRRPSPTEETARVVADVRDATMAFYAADTARSAEQVISLLWPEFTILVDGVRYNYEAVAEQSRTSMAGMAVFHTEWSDVRVERVGEHVAVASFVFRDSIVTRAGEVHRSTGSTTFVWQRRQGEWRIRFADANHRPVARAR